MSVFDDAICIIIAAPTGTRNAADNQNVRDDENAISDAPNVIDASITHLPSPCTDLRSAIATDEASAPAPAAPIRIPIPLGPACRIRSAKIGISTAYGMPVKLTTPIRISSARTGAVVAT